MSDPVSNAEIEDVLSSIRRLVSSDIRQGASGREAPGTPQTERLVLSPALRVDPVPADRSAHAADMPPGSQPRATAQAAETGSGTAAMAAPDATASVIAPDVPVADENAAHTAQGARDIRARVAEFEAVIARREDQWEPDGTAADGLANSGISAVPWDDPDPGDAADDDDTPRADALEGDIAPESRAGDEAEPQTSDKPMSHATTEDDAAKTDDGDAPDIAQAMGPSRAAGNAAPRDGTGSQDWRSVLGDEPVLDEMALRDLVAEIVREELQGALGERITRNVRKLVRREIRRVMSSQDFD